MGDGAFDQRSPCGIRQPLHQLETILMTGAKQLRYLHLVRRQDANSEVTGLDKSGSTGGFTAD
ncbi:hypothetical protein D3C85_1557970 [compost metagenome]